MTAAGHVNGYWCRDCGGTTYVIHVHEGVTPMFLACRAQGGTAEGLMCGQMARSLMYPWEQPIGSDQQLPIPPAITNMVAWEWYIPDQPELVGLDGETRDHVERGGLLLRELTAAGRTVLAAVTRRTEGDRHA
jgi:hypothetical protein